jgi:O-antigen/teichoic acid export membrane protein
MASAAASPERKARSSRRSLDPGARQGPSMSVSRNATYNLIGSVLPVMLALITVPIYLHLVGSDRYGVLAIAWLLLGYFGLFDLGLGRATTYNIAALKDADPQERADVFWTAIFTNIGMGIVGGLVLWAAADFFFDQVFKVDPRLRPEILASVPLLALAVPIATLNGVLSGALTGRERFLEINTVSVLSTSLFQIFPIVVALAWGPNLSQLLAAAVAARAIGIAVLWWRCHMSITRGQRHRFVASQARELLGYGSWVTITGLFGPILVILDRFVIGAVLGATAVTIYTLPFQLAQRITMFPQAVVAAVFPKLPTATPDERNALSEKAIRVLLATISLPILGMMYVLHPFLDLWVGKVIGPQAADVGTLIVFGYWANAFATVPYSWMQGAGRPDLVTKVLLIQIPFYLALLYFGMKEFGLIGCAAVFAFRCSADFLMMWWAARRRLHPAPLIATVGAPLLAGAIISNTLSYWDPLWWLSGLVLAVIVGLLCWRIAPPELIEKGRALLRTRFGRLVRKSP